MNEFQEQESAEKNRRGNPKMNVGEDAGCAAARWFVHAAAFHGTPAKGSLLARIIHRWKSGRVRVRTEADRTDHSRSCLALLTSSRRDGDWGWRARGSAAPTALRFVLDAHPALTGWANLWRASGACSQGTQGFFVRPRDSREDVNRAKLSHKQSEGQEKRLFRGASRPGLKPRVYIAQFLLDLNVGAEAPTLVATIYEMASSGERADILRGKHCACAEYGLE